MKNENNKNQKEVIAKGTIISAYLKTTRVGADTRTLNVVNFMPEDASVLNDIHAYDDSPKKYIPTWYKNMDGNIMLKSSFDVPVKNTDGEVVTFSDWLNAGLIKDAVVKIKWKEKPGAIYPISMIVLEDGTAFDYFEGM